MVKDNIFVNHPIFMKGIIKQSSADFNNRTVYSMNGEVGFLYILSILYQRQLERHCLTSCKEV